jgi:hypothetical protein
MEKLGRNAPREREVVSSFFARPSFETRAGALLRMRWEHAAHHPTLMLRRRVSAVSNHEAHTLRDILPSHRAEYFAACQGPGNRSEKSETRNASGE